MSCWAVSLVTTSTSRREEVCGGATALLLGSTQVADAGKGCMLGAWQAGKLRDLR